MFKLHRQQPSSGTVAKSMLKIFDVKKDISAKWKHLKNIFENSTDTEISKFLENHSSRVFYIFFEGFLLVESNCKVKGPHRAQKEELNSAISMLELILIHLPDLVHRRWQCNSIGYIIKTLLHSKNSIAVRKEGIHLFLLWMRCLRENVTPWMVTLYENLVPGFTGDDARSSIDSILNIALNSKYRIYAPLISCLLPPQPLVKPPSNMTKFFLDSLLEFMALKVHAIKWKDDDIMTFKASVFLWDLFVGHYLTKIFCDFDFETSVYSPCLEISRMKSAANDNEHSSTSMLLDSTITSAKASVIKWIVAFSDSIQRSKTSLIGPVDSKIRVSLMQVSNQLQDLNFEEKRTSSADLKSPPNDSSSECCSEQSIRLPDTYPSTSNASTLNDRTSSASSLTRLDDVLDTCPTEDKWIIQSVLFSTKKNINMIQEFFRQAFMLPASEASTIRKVIKVYQHWLQDKEVPIFMQYPPAEALLVRLSLPDPFLGMRARIDAAETNQTGGALWPRPKNKNVTFYTEDEMKCGSSIESFSKHSAETACAAQICAGPESTYQLFITNASYTFDNRTPLENQKQARMQLPPNDFNIAKGKLNSHCFCKLFTQEASDMIDVCKRVLSLYRYMAINVYLARDTWIQLLRVLMFIVRVLLRSPPARTTPPAKRNTVACRLAGPIFQALFVTWIKANLSVPVSCHMWDELVDLLSSHCGWEELIVEWANNMEIITRVLSRYVYKLEILDLPLDRLTEPKSKRLKRIGKETARATKESLFEQAYRRAAGRRSISFSCDYQHIDSRESRRSFANPICFKDNLAIGRLDATTLTMPLTAMRSDPSNLGSSSPSSELKSTLIITHDVHLSRSSSEITLPAGLKNSTEIGEKTSYFESVTDMQIPGESDLTALSDDVLNKEANHDDGSGTMNVIAAWSPSSFEDLDGTAVLPKNETPVLYDDGNPDVNSAFEISNPDDFEELANARLRAPPSTQLSSSEVDSVASGMSMYEAEDDRWKFHSSSDADATSQMDYVELQESSTSLLEGDSQHSPADVSRNSTASAAPCLSDRSISYNTSDKQDETLSLDGSFSSNTSDIYSIKEAPSPTNEIYNILPEIPEEDERTELVFRSTKTSKLLTTNEGAVTQEPDDNNVSNCGTLTGGAQTGWSGPVAAVIWRRLLGVLGDVNKIKDPVNHKLVFQYLLQLWEVLFKMRQNIGVDPCGETSANNLELIPPLQIASSWSFKAVMGLPESHREGKMNAYQLLCKMTIQRDHDTPLDREHLAQFYAVVHESLLSDDQEVVNKVIRSCTHYFSYCLPASTLLMLDFILAIRKICNLSQMQAPRVEAQTILGSMLFFPDLYKDLPVIKPTSVQPSVEICSNLKDHIVSVLIHSCKSEPSSAARCVALSSVGLWLFEELTKAGDKHPKIKEAIGVLMVLLKFSARMVALAACSQLCLLAQCYEGIMQALPSTPAAIIEVMCFSVINIVCDQDAKKNDPSRQLLVSNLLKSILTWCMTIPIHVLIESTTSNGELVLRTVFKAVQIAAQGKSNHQAKHSFSMTNISAESFDTRVQLGKAHDSAFQTQTSKIKPQLGRKGSESSNSSKLTANLVLNHLVNYMGQFPMARGTSLLGCIVSENHDLVGGAQELTPTLFYSPDVQFFCYNDTCLVSVMEIPAEEPDKPGAGPTAGMSSSDTCVRFVVRDAGGKYCWDSFILYGLPNVTDLNDAVKCSLPLYADDRMRETAEEILQSYMDYVAVRQGEKPKVADMPLPESGDGPCLDANDKLDQLLQHISSSSHECQLQSGLPLNIPSPPPPCLSQSLEEDVMNTLLRHHHHLAEAVTEDETPSNRYVILPDKRSSLQPEVPFHQARLMSMQLGFLSRDSRMKIHLLTKNERLLRELKNLDSRSCRESHKVALFYIALGQEDKVSILSNTGGSKDYEDFVAGLGWEVDLATHRGFRGKLQSDGSNGRTCPYYATSTLEVVFHVATRFPSNDEAARNVKIRHLGNDEVHIVWSEHYRDYRRDIIPTEFGDVLIVIYPVRHGLYRIQIMKKVEIPYFGPLFDGALVNGRVLPTLVRQTAINAGRAKRLLINLYQPFYEERTRYLQQIISQFKDQNTYEEFCAGLYRPGPFKKKKRIRSRDSSRSKESSPKQSPELLRTPFSTPPIPLNSGTLFSPALDAKSSSPVAPQRLTQMMDSTRHGALMSVLPATLGIAGNVTRFSPMQSTSRRVSAPIPPPSVRISPADIPSVDGARTDPVVPDSTSSVAEPNSDSSDQPPVDINATLPSHSDFKRRLAPHQSKSFEF